MLIATPPTAGTRQRGLLFRILRLVLGYVLGIAAGAIIFTITAAICIPDLSPVAPSDSRDLSRLIGQTAFLYFVLGLVFGIPYTVLGSVAVSFWLRRSLVWFWLIGTFCPAAALLLMFSLLGGVTFEWKMLMVLLATLPAGFVATYVYGAVGFGWGFGWWRSG